MIRPFRGPIRPAVLCVGGVCVGVCAACLGIQAVLAQAISPRLDTIFPCGAPVGSSTEVQISGADLDDADQLLFSHPGIRASRKLNPIPQLFDLTEASPNTFIVRVDADVPAGPYEVRAVGRFGISNPRVYLVASLAQHIIRDNSAFADKPQPIEAGMSIHATAEADRVHPYQLQVVDRPQRLIIECVSQRIDSRMDPLLVLRDSAGRERMRARDGNHRNPLLAIEAIPGTYRLDVSDFLYQGGPSHAYILRIHTGPHVVGLFPPCATPGSETAATVFGYQLSEPAEMDINTLVNIRSLSVEQQAVTLLTPAGRGTVSRAFVPPSHAPAMATLNFPYRFARGAELVQQPVHVGLAERPVRREDEHNDTPDAADAITVPCEYIGQFNPQSDSDWFTFEVPANTGYSLRVLSASQGSGADPVLRVEMLSPDGAAVERQDYSDDHELPVLSAYPLGQLAGRQLDPLHVIEAKPNVTRYRVCIWDNHRQSRAGPHITYRCLIEPQSADFRLLTYPLPVAKGDAATPGTLVMYRGGSAILPVIALRSPGFTGAIRIEAQRLPAGVTCDPIVLDGNRDRGTLIFRARHDVGRWAGTIDLLGTCIDREPELPRSAETWSMVWDSANVQRIAPIARSTCGVGMAILEQEVAPLAIHVSSPSTTNAKPGSQVKFNVRLDRHGVQDPVQLALIGMPDGVKVDGATINQDEGDLTLTLPDKGVASGRYTFYFQAEIARPFQRNPTAVHFAETKANRLQTLWQQQQEDVRQATTEKEQAENALAVVRQNLNSKLATLDACQSQIASGPTPELEQQLSAAQQAVKDSEQEVAKITEQLAQATRKTEQKTARAEATKTQVDQAQAALQQANAANQPQPLTHVAHSSPIEIRIHAE